MADPLLQARSRVALAVRFGNAAAERDARAELGLQRVARAIRADLPHLRPAQRAELAGLLAVGVVDGQR